MIDHRPSSGGGSCSRCRAALGLASQKVGGAWYCSSDCARGGVSADPPSPRVPQPWLEARPRRFFRKRQPKELRSTEPGS
ncbi:MAG: hypothetical protein VX546_09085 [Myxococcota bacterium]|nr:hypothetical protein [Myxococcota bacterium]